MLSCTFCLTTNIGSKLLCLSLDDINENSNFINYFTLLYFTLCCNNINNISQKSSEPNNDYCL